MVKYRRGAKRYLARNPGLASLIVVNGRKRRKNRRSPADGGALRDAKRFGLFGSRKANRKRRRSTVKTANGSTLGIKRPRRKNRRRTAPKRRTTATPVRRRKNRRIKGATMRTRRRRRRSAARRANPVRRRRARRAARRSNPIRRRRRARKSNRRAAPKRRRRRVSNKRRAAPRRRRRRNAGKRRAAPRRRRRRNAGKRRAAPRRRRRRRNVARRAAPRRRRRRNAAKRRAAPRRRRRRNVSTRRAAPRRRKRRANGRRRAAPKRRRRNRRPVGGYRTSFGSRMRLYNARRPARRRRRNSGSSIVSGTFSSVKSTLRGAPALLVAGANVGGGFLGATALSGAIEGLTQGRLGRFNGIASALAAMAVGALIFRTGIQRKIPVAGRYLDSQKLMIGVGLYGLTQVLKLVLPEGIKARLGLGEYMRGPMGDYVTYGPSAMQTVGGLGGLSEYVGMGAVNAATQAQADGAAAQAMAASNPQAVADALLDQCELQEATFSGAGGMGRMGEYVQTGGTLGAGAGGLGGGYDGGFWLGQGQYATYANPEPPASRFLNYGNTFMGLGMAQMPAGQQFAPMPGGGIPAVAMPQAPSPVASTPFSPSCAPGCGPMGPNCGPGVDALPMGASGDCLPIGQMPLSAQGPCALPVPAVGCGIDAGGLFQSPWQNLIANVA